MPILLIAAAVAVVACVASSAGLLGGTSRQADDLLQPGTDSTGDVVVVGIDRLTLASIEPAWPWPRAVHADLIDLIAVGEPSAVVYDVLFADPSDDTRLAPSLAERPVVLASAVTLSSPGGDVAEILDRVEPVASLGEAAAGAGFANVSVSTQRGVVRTLPFYARGHRGLVEPSLTAAALAAIDGVAAYVERPDGLQIGSRLVPLERGALRVNYAAELIDPDEVIPAISVLTGEVGSTTFEGKVVVVGVTEPTLGDLHLVPPDKSGSVPGVLVHANALNTVLAQAWVEPAATPAEWFLIALVALATAAAFVLLRLRYAGLVAVALLVGVVAWGSWRFSTSGELWDIVWPTLAVVGVAGAATVYRYLAEIRHRRRAELLFGEYVPDNIVEDLADPHRLEAALAGRRVDVAVLFCDLRGFTPIAADLDPGEVRRLLDIYYDYASEIVLSHGGTVLQFVGDEVFAVFGTPVATDDDAGNALEAATDLVDGVMELDRRLSTAGLPSLRFGIAVHRGEVLAAHVGSAAHRQYAVIGDPVNVGSRLCSKAGPGQVVASSAVGSTRRRFEVDGEVALKGVADPMPILRYRSASVVEQPG